MTLAWNPTTLVQGSEIRGYPGDEGQQDHKGHTLIMTSLVLQSALWRATKVGE